MATHMAGSRDLDDRIAELQQSWYGWGSPVGLGLGLALVVASIATLMTVFRRRSRPGSPDRP